MELVANRKKIRKLIHCIHRMVVCLEEHRHDLIIPSQTDQFYFMQKEAELTLLSDLLEDTVKRLQTINTLLGIEYKEVYCRWRKDVRWLNTYLNRNS